MGNGNVVKGLCGEKISGKVRQGRLKGHGTKPLDIPLKPL